MSVDLAKLTALAGAVKERSARTSGVRKPWEIRNAGADTAELFIYDLIGDWGVSASDFVTELAAVTAPNLDVRVNSEGGQVFDGVAIYEAIKRHPAKTTGYVDGLAASAASFIVMACDRVLMAKTARMMIHDAGVGGFYVEGKAADIRDSIKELQDFADLLDSLSDTIAGIYADKAGGTVADWRAAMSKDKWYTAEESVSAGLADGITGQEDNSAEAGSTAESTARWDSQQFIAMMREVFE